MKRLHFSRRYLLKLALAGAAASGLGGAGARERRTLGRIVVIGGGYGGVTAAKTLRLWSEGALEVTLIEPRKQFVSCPISNLVIGGSKSMRDITLPYEGLRKYGVTLIRDRAMAIDADRRLVRLQHGDPIRYDRLVLSPGVAFMFDAVQGMDATDTQHIPHAWQAGPQTRLLRAQLVAMRDGGTVVMSIPLAPYRCPPGPYERACQIANYLKTEKPRSKLIVLDANPEIVSKKDLFLSVFNKDYKDILEYHPESVVSEVDVAGRRFITEFGDQIEGDVLNLIPPQRAADIARDAGVITANERWCEIDWLTLESIKAPGIHIIGDATLPGALMPKSGHMAHQHGKAAAAAIVELMHERPPIPPTMANVCYSFIDAEQAVHISGVYRYVPETHTMEPVPGAGGVSPLDRTQWGQEGEYAWSWAQSIWTEMLS